MLLKELNLFNFRQYIGEQKIVFSTDKEKNITLLLGENTSGKTTFVQAFRWILYDDSDFTKTKKNTTLIINDKVRRGMSVGDKKTVSASLKLEHQKKEYVIKRELEYHCKRVPTEVSTPYPSILTIETEVGNGEWRKVPLDVNNILPSDLAEYFFFDGEKIGKSTNSKNVEQSINAIMGLVPLKEMIDHLNPASTSSVYQQMDCQRRKDDPSGSIAPHQRDLERARKSLESCEEKVKREKTRNEICCDAWIDARDAFNNIANIAQKQKDLQSKETQIEKTQQKINVAKNDLFEAFTPMMMEQYLKMMSNSILSNLEKYNIVDKGIPDITSKTIKFLLERGKCACGCDLSANEGSRQLLEELLHYIPPQSIGTQLTSLKKEMSHYIRSNEKTDRFKNRQEDYIRENRLLENYSTERIQLLHEIGNQGTDAKAISENYEKRQKEYKESNDNLTIFKAQTIEWQKKVNAEKNTIDELSKSAGINTELDKELSYVSALYSKAQKEYDCSSAEILKKIRGTFQSVFDDMYHGERTVLLDNNYKITLSTEGTDLDLSKGAETVKNFAFIATLLKVAQERANEELELDAEPYPLVMDAVFSNVDEVHIRRICKELPKMAEQGILAIMDKDWNVAKKTLSDNVGAIYRIVKKDGKDDRESHIVEVSINDS